METSVNSSWTTHVATPLPIDISDLPGKTLVDHSGHKIGKIAAVPLDHQTGRTDFMTIRRGGFLGYGAEWFLEPIDRIAEVRGNAVTID